MCSQISQLSISSTKATLPLYGPYTMGIASFINVQVQKCKSQLAQDFISQLTRSLNTPLGLLIKDTKRMTEVESNTFDDVIKQAKEKELLPHFKLSEVHSLERSVGEGGNWAEKVNTSKSVNGTGAISHIEKLRELAKPFEEHFSFEFVLGKGDKLPKYENVGKVFEEGKVSLEHKPGEVMLIDVWATWCGPCQKPMQHNQDMLEKNAEAWKDKVRIVAVSVDDNLDAVKKRVEQKKWNKIDHLTLGSWDGEHDLIKFFQISGIPFVCLIDKNGIINYTGHPSGCKLEDKINELINEPEAAAPAAPTASAEKPAAEIAKAKLGLDSWAKFQKILSNPPADIKGLESFTISTSKTRSFNNGVQSVSVEPLTIKYETSKENRQAHENAVAKIKEALTPNEIKVSGFVNDPELILNSYYEKVSEILKANGIKQEPVIREKRTLDIKTSSEWNKTKAIAYPDLAYKKDAEFAAGEAVQKAFEEYYEEVQERDTSSIDTLMSAYPFRVVGHPFAGISGLKDYVDNSPKTLEAVKGQVNFIIIGANHPTCGAHAEDLIKVLAKHPGKAHLHIINIDSSKPKYVDTIIESKNPDVSLYRGELNAVNDLRVLSIQAYDHLTVIDPSGIVRQNKKGHLNEDADLSQFEKLTKDHQLTEELVKKLEALPSNEAIKKLHSQLKELHYPVKVVLSFTEEYPLNKPDHKSAKNLELNIGLRESDQALIKPLLDVVGTDAQIHANYVKTFEIPNPTTCVDCHAALAIPYYYYHTSNTQRCVACAEKENEGETKLKRYAVNENGVLVLGDRLVDLKRFGKNIQPKTDEECEGHGFSCNGCRSGSEGQARYICMGCRREPNPRDYVDFCFGCAKKIRAGIPEEIKKINDANTSEGHNEKHPLLRVLFGVNGYYDF